MIRQVSHVKTAHERLGTNVHQEASGDITQSGIEYERRCSSDMGSLERCGRNMMWTTILHITRTSSQITGSIH